MTEQKARGMEFCGWCVRAFLAGAKTQTRRVKVGGGGRSNSTGQMKGLVPENGITGRNPDSSRNPELQAQYQDCPGCAKCEGNDGLVLRRGSWRPTSAYEMVFLLTKSDSYYCDAEAVREAHAEPWRSTGKIEKMGTGAAMSAGQNDGFGLTGEKPREYNPAGRNLRNVWTINPQPYPRAHFATFPEKLVDPCIRAGTSPKACGECGAPWARVVDKSFIPTQATNDAAERRGSAIRDPAIRCDTRARGYTAAETKGWRATCDCNAVPVPCVVLDPFAGSGTVGVVCKRLGRNFVGMELSEDYCQQARQRLSVPVAKELFS